MDNHKLEAFKELLGTPKKIVIIPHKNPDGDALGSCLALQLFLTKSAHTAVVISPNEYPEFLCWMPNQEEIIKFSKSPDQSHLLINDADIVFTMDFNQLNRIDYMSSIVSNCPAKKVMIDHHENPGDYAALTYSDSERGSTCEMVFELIYALDASLIDSSIATCLYTGMMTDSGSFRFPSTTARTHQIISILIEKGAQPHTIHQKIYDTFSFDRLKLLGTTLNNMKKIEGLPVVYMTLSQKELDDNQFKKGDTEGFVNYGLSLLGIRLAVIMIENTSEKIIKMSFRSKGTFDVNQFAKKYFNGGGHINAAGGISSTSLENTVTQLRNSIENEKSQFDV
ncbi:MAG: bifunctional oligoribonuclease/PAP phosphatase NrnA [Bacteroidetes bacterium]|nr:bifunctional oligoribonuclease/PAP phosphatase NrnA [Bacteroidota bacterium]